MTRRFYAVTAYSAVNALGQTTNEVLAGLDEGRSGLGPSPIDIPMDTFVGAVPGELAPLPSEYRAFDCRMARIAALALVDVRGAVDRAVGRWGADRVAVILGTSTGGLEATENAFSAWRDTGAVPEQFDYHRQHDFNAMGTLLSKMTGIEGPVYTISTACSSGGKVMAVIIELLGHRTGVSP
ncbi:MAG: beta-ketoacyl synthase N-terminal-like domain-containing protein, partial [Myxococcota bacterium]